MIYTAEYTVPSYLCDYRDKLTMWGVARLFQEDAGNHVDSAGLGFAQLIAQGRAWVLCRTCYQVQRLPQEGERVTSKTWSRGTDGLFAFREHLMLDTDGNQLVRCSSYWAVIDFASRHVIRLHEMMAALESHTESATQMTQLNRLRIPKSLELGNPVSQFPVQTSMIDHTKHVNNAEYIKWIFDSIGEPLTIVNEPYELALEYFQETQPNENVSVFKIRDNDATYYQICDSREVKVVAKISL